MAPSWGGARPISGLSNPRFSRDSGARRSYSDSRGPSSVVAPGECRCRRDDPPTKPAGPDCSVRSIPASRGSGDGERQIAVASGVQFFGLASPWLMQVLDGGRGQLAQSDPLPTPLVEVIWREPSFVGCLQRGPFLGNHREPCGVATSVANDCGSAEGSLMGQAESTRGPAGPSVQRIALPLQAPVAKSLHGVGDKQVHRIGRDSRACNPRAPVNVADLDGLMSGIDPHQRLPAFNSVGGAIDHCEKERIDRRNCSGKPGVEFLERGWCGLGHVAKARGPIRRARGGEEIVPMRVGVERFEARIPPLEHDAFRHIGRPWVGNPWTDRQFRSGIDFLRYRCRVSFSVHKQGRGIQ